MEWYDYISLSCYRISIIITYEVRCVLFWVCLVELGQLCGRILAGFTNPRVGFSQEKPGFLGVLHEWFELSKIQRDQSIELVEFYFGVLWGRRGSSGAESWLDLLTLGQDFHWKNLVFLGFLHEWFELSKIQRDQSIELVELYFGVFWGRWGRSGAESWLDLLTLG